MIQLISNPTFPRLFLSCLTSVAEIFHKNYFVHFAITHILVNAFCQWKETERHLIFSTGSLTVSRATCPVVTMFVFRD